VERHPKGHPLKLAPPLTATNPFNWPAGQSSAVAIYQSPPDRDTPVPNFFSGPTSSTHQTVLRHITCRSSRLCLGRNRRDRPGAQLSSGIPDDTTDALLGIGFVVLAATVLHASGGYVVNAADAIIRPAADHPEQPESKIGDFWMMKRFSPESDLKENKFVSEFYDLHQDIEKIVKRIKTLRENGDFEEANKVSAENRSMLSYAQITSSTNKAISAIRKRERSIYNEPRGQSPEMRRDELSRLAKEKNRLAERAMVRRPNKPVPVFNPFRDNNGAHF
jgi:hypothetical protein